MANKKVEFTTPILYLAFNRLDFVKKTFAQIQKVKPTKIFIACDGPRTKKEKEKTDAVRKWILENINWKCEVKTLFRDKNLGCRFASNGAIDWFFENVEEGIVLEDDNLADESFFKFCEEMLGKYRNENKVMSISGYNFIRNLKIKESYYFSKYFECWGFALWKRSWEKQDLHVKKYLKLKESGKLKKYISNPIERILWNKRVENILNGKVSSWSYCFYLSHILNNGLCITSKINLIKNIGFSENSTHTKENIVDGKFLNLPSKSLSFPLIHPKKVELNKKLSFMWFLKDLTRVFLKKIFLIKG